MQYSKTIIISLITLGIILIVFGAHILGHFNSPEMMTLNARFQFRGATEPSPEDIIIIFIDETTLETLPYISPFPRDYLANMVMKLDDAGARVIGIDIFLDLLSNPTSCEADTQEISIQDEILHRSMKKAENVFLVSFVEENKKEDNKELLPHPYFRNVIAGYGASNIPIGLSDVYMHTMIPAWEIVNNHIALSFTTSIYAYLKEIDKEELKQKAHNNIPLFDNFAPLDEFLINFAGPPSHSKSKTFKSYSAKLLMDDMIPEEWIKDKIVFIGAGYMTAQDKFRTPFYGRKNNRELSYGVEIHANCLHTLLRENFIHLTPKWLDFIIILLLSLPIALICSKISILKGIPIVFGEGLIYYIISYPLFYKQIQLPVIAPITAIFLTFFGITIYRSLTEEREKQRIKGIFSKYVSKDLVKELLVNPKLLELGGEERVMTAFFTDLEGFTRISEKMSPKQLVNLLNNYLAEMTDILFKYDGTLDKYEGDAIIAFFGAPIYFEDHALRACYTALDMQKRLAELREEWKNDKPKLYMRIGINTGSMVVGNMGSNIRFDYTMLGDTVNLSARLEGGCKQYGIYTLIGESTYQDVKDKILCRFVDCIKVIGRTQAINVYELICRKSDPQNKDEKLREFLETYNSGIEFYHKQEWEQALTYFTKCLQLQPKDRPSITYIDRCEEFIENPPDVDWDGSYKLEFK